jgi:hypothetical protein
MREEFAVDTQSHSTPRTRTGQHRTLSSAATTPRQVPDAVDRALVAREPSVPARHDQPPASARQVATRSEPRGNGMAITGGLIVRGSGSQRISPFSRGLTPHKRRVPLWVLGNLAAIAVIGAIFVVPNLTGVATASACNWYAVQPGDTLKDISAAHQSDALTVAKANHVDAAKPLYVGEKLCMPTAWFAQARSAPYIPPPTVAQLSLPAGIWAGEPCTADRSIVWTVPVSRWTVPPGCFGQIYFPNPLNYMVNGQVIGGFGWCNWWPEALTRNPNILNFPGHGTPRIGYPVFYVPQPGQSVGHYAFVESIGLGQNTGWLLISEMNMYWRGGGWAAVDYRYIRVDYPGATYLYPN